MELLKKILEKSFRFAAISWETSRTGCPHTKYKGTQGTPNILQNGTMSTDRYYFWSLRPSECGSPYSLQLKPKIFFVQLLKNILEKSFRFAAISRKTSRLCSRPNVPYERATVIIEDNFINSGRAAAVYGIRTSRGACVQIQ